MTKPASIPKYNVTVVARVILEEALELHPQHLRGEELAQRIVSDPDDRKEMDTATQAISDLRESGLLTYRGDGDIVQPTRAALLAGALLAGLT